MNRQPGHVRIIAGRLRGSKLPVPDRPGLRPSSDRVRETLFNWLQPMLPGARVLDLFAGTGALGLEAASRGAAEVLLVERDPGLAEGLRATAARLKADAVRVEAADALAWLARPATPRFGLAFVDPPFGAGLHAPALAALQPWLSPGAFVYVEDAADAAPSWPAGWTVHREGRTREVRFTLLRCSDGAAGGGAATLPADTPPQGAPTA